MPNPTNPRRIFVVDDERVIALSLGMILRNEGFDVTSFTDPVEALRAVSTKAPDLLISDVVMPPFSGIELAIKLGGMCPDCKVILFSGQPSTAQLLENAKADGYNFDVLAKPVPPKVLLEEVRSELGLDS